MRRSYPFRIEFVDPDGTDPVGRWLRALELVPRAAIGLALRHLLEQHGPSLAGTRWVRALEGGLHEFRLKDELDALLGHLGLPRKAKLRQGWGGVIFVRIFFHVHGSRLILLLGAYDKGKHPQKGFQQAQIKLARRRLSAWKLKKNQNRTDPA